MQRSGVRSPSAPQNGGSQKEPPFSFLGLPPPVAVLGASRLRVRPPPPNLVLGAVLARARLRLRASLRAAACAARWGWSDLRVLLRFSVVGCEGTALASS